MAKFETALHERDGMLTVTLEGAAYELAHIRAAEVARLDLAEPLTLLRMDQMRAAAGVPVHIHMVFDDSGHSQRSRHYVTEDRPFADACDFHFGPGLTPLEEFSVVMLMGWGGVGYYPFWRPRPGWHVDLRPIKANGQRTLWWRDDKGEYNYGWQDLAEVLAQEPLDSLF